MHFLALFFGWLFFAFAVVNLIDAAYLYVMTARGTGSAAIIRLVLISAAFAGWQWLTYGK